MWSCDTHNREPIKASQLCRCTCQPSLAQHNGSHYLLCACNNGQPASYVCPVEQKGLYTYISMSMYYMYIRMYALYASQVHYMHCKSIICIARMCIVCIVCAWYVYMCRMYSTCTICIYVFIICIASALYVYVRNICIAYTRIICILSTCPRKSGSNFYVLLKYKW